MKLIGGTASHVGNVREVNQDRVYYRGAVAALADGMGGHQGGEQAAELAIGEFEIAGQRLNGSDLVEIVQQANREVHHHAADTGLAGMGTTLVAMTLHDDNTVTVANVGDSRAYWLRGDQLSQVTDDHSFVEDLVRQGRLTPEEAATHPQRNILTRAVGIGADVEVDRFSIGQPTVGDRFLLCSDGLFNEISEEEITRILTKTVDPEDAATALVSAALSTPCRDNVTVAVVDVVDDNDPAVIDREEAVDTAEIDPDKTKTAPIPVVAGAVLHDPESPDDAPAVEPGAAEALEMDGDTGGETAGSRATARRAPTLLLEDDHEYGEVDEAAEVDPDRGDPELYTETAEMEILDDPVSVGPRGGRGALYGILGLLVVGVLAAGAYFGAQTYAQASFFVDADDSGQLSVYQGRRGGFLGLFQPVELTPSAEVNQDEVVSTDDLANVLAAEFDNEQDAQAALTELAPTQDSSVQPVGDPPPQDDDDQSPSEGSGDDATDTGTDTTTNAPTSTTASTAGN